MRGSPIMAYRLRPMISTSRAKILRSPTFAVHEPFPLLHRRAFASRRPVYTRQAQQNLAHVLARVINSPFRPSRTRFIIGCPSRISAQTQPRSYRFGIYRPQVMTLHFRSLEEPSRRGIMMSMTYFPAGYNQGLLRHHYIVPTTLGTGHCNVANYRYPAAHPPGPLEKEAYRTEFKLRDLVAVEGGQQSPLVTDFHHQCLAPTPRQVRSEESSNQRRFVTHQISQGNESESSLSGSYAFSTFSVNLATSDNEPAGDTYMSTVDLQSDTENQIFEHGPTDLPPRQYIGGSDASSPWKPRKNLGTIPGSALDCVSYAYILLSAVSGL